MQWLNLEQSGFAVSIEELNGKKQFFLKKISDTPEEYLSKISEIGFVPVEDQEGLYTAPLSYIIRNQLLSLDGAFLFPTKIEEKHEDPFLGFRPIRPRSLETPDGTLPPEAGDNEENRGDRQLPGDDRPTGTGEDSGIVSGTTGDKPIIEDGGSPGPDASQHQVDEGSDPSSDEGNDLPSSGGRDTGTGDGRDGGLEPDVAGSGQRELESEVEEIEAEIVEENKNPNHFYLNEETFWTEFSNTDRLNANITAIQLMKLIEKRETPATEEEKTILAQYAGWGGVKLDGRSGQSVYSIAREHKLTEEEQDSLQRNALDAYYTSPTIIKPLWQSIRDNLGFNGGEILESAVGVGNFLGFAPKEIVERSKFHGTELDNLSGRIVKLLYPDANLQIRGFEDFHPPENYFDLAITNVPFGQNRPYDKHYPNSHSIHNYFICKSLDLLKPGAIGVYVTSSYTMDSVGTKARREMNDKAHLLSAIRMPIDALKDHSNIEVMMDVLIFQKRVTPRPITEPEPDWINTHSTPYYYSKYQDPDEVVTNEYFINHPSSLAGRVDVVRDGRYGSNHKRVVIADPERPFEELFPAILNASLSSPRVQELLKTNKESATARDKIFIPEEPTEKLVELETQKNLLGSFVKQDGKIYQIKYRSGDGLDEKTKGVEVTGNAKKLRRLASFIDLRDTLSEHYQVMMRTEGDDPDYIAHRALLTIKYEGFVSLYGHLNDKVNVNEYKTDPEYCKVITLESNDRETKKVTRASIFTERVLGKDKEVTHADSVQEAVSLSLNKFNSINLEYIGALCEKDVLTVEQDLAGKIFKNPMTKNWEMADLYLSGNVRQKLQQAERAAAFDSFYQSNVAALEKVIPVDIPAEDIAVRVGVSWVSIQDYKEFIATRLRTHINNVNLHQKESDGSWTFYFGSEIDSEKQTVEFGTERKSFTDILKASLHQRVVEVYDDVEVMDENGEIKKKRVYNHKETIAAQQKQEELQNDFKKFLFFSDEKRTEKMVRIYNDKMNAYVAPTFDGSHLTFPGLNPFFNPRSVQANAIYRALHDSTLLNHEVGVGKTFEQIAIAMEMRRLGLSKKPLLVVANHTLRQINKDAQELYPGKKVLMLTKEDFNPKNRKMFVGKIANNDWDLVIMGHSVFERIPMDKDFEQAFINEQIGIFRAELHGLQESSEGLTKTEAQRFGAKAIARKIATLEAQLRKITDTKRDEGIQWSELGFDCLLVDEADRYKNLMITSSNSNIANMPASKRAQDLLLKVRFLEQLRQDGKGIVFATGTPVSNSPLEIYTMQRFLQMDELDSIGIARASDWYSNFIYPKVTYEPSHAGTGWNIRVRPCLSNIPELIAIFSSTMDTATALDAGIVRPDVEFIIKVSPMSPVQKVLMKDLDKRSREKTDHIFTIMHLGQNMAISPKLVKGYYPPEYFTEFAEEEIDPPYSKINTVADTVLQEWQQSRDTKGTQLIFSDVGVPNKDREYTVYTDVKKKLMARGIPEHEIQFIHDYEDDKEKEKLFDQVRSGEVSVLLGSSEKLGIGTNVQDKIVAMHHIDAPWTPSKVTQRNGRGLRFGNTNKELRIYVYTTQDTFDLFKWNLLNLKDKQFKQVMSGKGARTYDLEIDPSFADIAAVTSGNPLIREKLEVEEAVTKLDALYGHFLKEKTRIESFIRHREESIGDFKKGIEKLKLLPEIPEDAVFKIKALKYDPLFGDDNKELEFKADDIETVTKMLRMIREKTHRTLFLDDTLTFGNVPIHFFQKPAAYDPETILTVWRVGDFERPSLRKAQETLVGKHQTIENLESRIVQEQKKIIELKEKLTAGFEKEHELVELKIKFRTIVKKIEKISEKPSEFPLHEAVETNNLAEFKRLCDENPDLLDVQNKAGLTPVDLIESLKRDDFQEYVDDQTARCAP